jgi:hypothetical protein
VFGALWFSLHVTLLAIREDANQAGSGASHGTVADTQ